MLEVLLRSMISGGLIIAGQYIALNIYFKYINKELLPKSSRLDEETKRKFKAICNMEYRKPIDQENLIISNFIEKYTIEHNIDWNEVEY